MKTPPRENTRDPSDVIILHSGQVPIRRNAINRFVCLCLVQAAFRSCTRNHDYLYIYLFIQSNYSMPLPYRVLYVDDEPALLDITRRFLEETGLFSVDCVLSGSEALGRIAAGQYDAVVADYQMPGMNGIALLQKVRETDTALPFILFTGRGREEVVIESINSGADFYVQKGGGTEAQYAELSHKIRTAVERRISEKALKESENRYRSLVENLHDCVAVYQAVADGRDFVILEFNHAAEKTEGMMREEVIGRRVTEVFPGVQEFGILDVFRRVWSTGIPESFPVSFYKDNRISGWRDNFIYKLPSGEIVASYSDETARKQAEEALRQEKNFSDRLLDAQQDTVLVFEPVTAKPVRWNKRFAEVSGYPDDEIAGMKAPGDFYDEDDLNKARDAMAGMPARHVTVEMSLVTKQGAHIPFEYSSTAIETTDGRNLLLSIGRDITGRKLIESELERKNQDLMASYEQMTASEEELKSQFDALAQSERTLRLSEERLIMAQEIGQSGRLGIFL